MAKVTRTLNPLPFQDLEPHRFEDLVRQVAYDFKNWRSLEATGRLGSDDGYDARGFEITDPQAEEEVERAENEEDDLPPLNSDRLWQIQCKREKEITPTKMEKHLDEMFKKGSPTPYGVIFASACDFSKKTRDVFAEKMQKKKVQEFHLWGRAELEDMLVQPKNDHLLFGYFGISLVIRRRTLKSQIRSVLATKRKVVKCLGSIDQDTFTPMFIREVSDTDYPYSSAIPDFKKRPRWKIYYFLGHTHDGIRVMVRKYFAYGEFDYQKMKVLKWDYSEEHNLAIDYEDQWNKGENDSELFQRGHAFLDKMKDENRAFFVLEGVIPYERIVEIDPIGDPLVKYPHVFVELKNNTFFDYQYAFLIPQRDWVTKFPISRDDDKNRVKVFPKKFPKLPKPKPLPPMGSKNENTDKTTPEFERLNKKE